MTAWYTWVFEGVGTLAVGGACGFLIQHLFKKMHRESDSPRVSGGKNSSIASESPVSASVSGPITASQVAVGTNISQIGEVHHHHGEGGLPEKWILTEPTPDQILREVDSALPFAQENTRRHYIGLSIVWRAFFSGAVKINDSWLVMTTPSEGVMAKLSINMCFLLTSIPADLNCATEGSALLVKGSIQKVESSNVQLESDPLIRVVKRA